MARGSINSGRGAAGSGPLAGISPRAQRVWISLVSSMTLVGGILLAFDGRPAPRVDGLSVPPLLASGTAANIESVFRTRSALDKARWKGIVIHHSGSPTGSPASIEAEHRAMRFKGLGHHFVIGNGRGMDDGELHVGYRWLDQLPGAHAGGEKGEWLNKHTVSICLVGNGDREPFTKAQLARLAQLIAALRGELTLPAESVTLHSKVAPTNDPGKFFPAAWLSEQLLATGGN